MDDRREKVEQLLDRLQGAKCSGDSGRQWVALCPAHEDRKHSLAIGLAGNGNILLKCYAGCATEDVLRQVDMTFENLFPEAEAARPRRAVTLKELAWDKRLPADFLTRECGLTDVPGDGVHIPYYDADLHRIETKRRVALQAKDGSYWPKGKPLVAYGIWKRQEAVECGKVILVEGESDCWTLWHHGFPALGIPGASATKTLTADLLNGIAQVYVWQEPGSGGEEFAAGIARQLKELAWSGTVSVIRADGIKDPNALHQRDPDEFKATFQAIVDAAKPLPPAPKKTGERKKREKRHGHIPDSVAAGLAEVEKIPPPAPGFFGLTDLGNAKRLVFRHEKSIRYCHVWNKWLVWDGRIWRADNSGEIDRKAADTVEAIYVEASKGATAELRMKIGDHAIQSEAEKSLRAMTLLARSRSPIPIAPTSLDVDPWMFNCFNGTVSLRSGELQPHARGDGLTKLSHVVYDREATCPTWDGFLHRIMAGNVELSNFLRLAVGYSMTGVVEEKCFFFLYGFGDNGKSTFIELLADLLGDYWMKTTAETVLDKSRTSTIPNDVARLAGVRMVSTAELPKGRRLDEARVKDLTGRDTISARFMRGEWFDFRPVFKLWMYGNHKPTIEGVDDGIWRRVRLIPFAVTIPKADQDERLLDKLRGELPGILNWAIRGCLEWQKSRLPMPVAIQEATEDYRSEMDLIELFLVEKCHVIKGSKVAGAQVTVLYRAYEWWCHANGEKVPNQRTFSSTLRTKGFSQHRGGMGVRSWKGIQLLPPPERPTKNGTGGNSDLTFDFGLSEYDK